MQNESSNTKKIVSGVVLLAVLAYAVYFFFFRNSTPEIVLDEFGNPVAAQVVGQDLIDTLVELQSVTLDDNVFTTAAFRSLTDFSVVLTPETPGRTNPFSPITGAR